MDAYQSSAKAYRGKFFLLTLILILIIGLLTTLLFIRDEQVKTVLEEHLPVLSKTTEVDTLKTNLQRHVEAIKSTSDGESLWRYHQAVMETLRLLKPLSANTSYDKLLTQLASYDEQVERLASVSERNNQLKNQVVIQLQLLVDQLRLLETKIENQKSTIKQNVESSSRISIEVARDQLRTMERYHLYRQSLDNSELVLEIFKSLSLNSNLAQLVILSDRMESIIVQWQSQLSLSETHSEEALAAFELIQTLNDLLYIDARALAKWRSSIRITNEYRLTLSTMPELTEKSLGTQKLNKEILPAYLPEQVKALLEQYPWFNPVMVQWAIFAFAGVGAFLCLLLLSAIKRSIVYQNKKNIALVESYAEGEAVESSEVNEEVHELCQLIAKLEKPEHGEKDYQKVCQELTQVNRLLAYNAKVYVFQVSESHPYRELAQQLASSSAGMLKSWREHFEKSTVSSILAMARTAKKDGELVQHAVTNVNDESFKLYILFKDNAWFGFLQAEQQLKTLQAELASNQQTSLIEAKKHASQMMANAESLKSMLITAMLQTQIPEADNKSITSKLYRQLWRMTDWCQLTSMSAQVESEQANMELVSVNLLHELQGLFYTLSSESQTKRNEISFSIANDIEPHVQLNAYYFRYCLESIVRASFADTINSALQVSVNLADKNKGQQIVRFAIECYTERKISEVPAKLAQLVEETSTKGNTKTTSQLGTIVDVIHGTDIVAELTDFGFKFSISVPCAIESSSRQKEPSKDVIKLKNKHILLLDDGHAYNQELKALLQSYHADVATLSDSHYFNQQVSVAHLQKKSLDLIIVSPHIFRTDYLAIEQHIGTLPTALRPKLFCLQPEHHLALSKTGIFKHSLPLCQLGNILEDLAKLINSEEKSNMLVPSEMFVQHQAGVSQSDLLLAVQNPEEHQSLYRLLRWLGFNIVVVSHLEAYNKEWGSGRFLLMITDFNEQPVLELLVGNNINRSVFTLNNANYVQELKHKRENWQVAKLPSCNDPSQVVKHLEPWLKEPISYQVPKQQSNSLNTNNQDHQQISKARLSNDALLDELAAFDLVKFADNQGGPELAALMLEEYVEEIELLIEKLCQAVKAGDKPLTEQLLDNIEVPARILAAQDAIEIIAKMRPMLCQLNSPALSNELIELKLVQEKLSLACEAI